MTQIHECCEVNCFAFSPCFIDHLLFVLNFYSCHDDIFFILFHSSSTAAFYIRNLHCLVQRNNLVHKIVRTHGIEPSFGIVILMIFVLNLCCALSGQLASFAFVCVPCFALFLLVVVGVTIFRCQCSSRFSSFGSSSAFQDEFSEVFRDLHGITESICASNFFRAFFQCFIGCVILVGMINSSQLSRIVELLAFLLPNAALLSAEISLTYLTEFLAICSPTWTSREALSISDWTTHTHPTM